MKRARLMFLLAVLVMLIAAALACDVNNPPTWTPSPPQMTAGALNATYQAQATQTAAGK